MQKRQFPTLAGVVLAFLLFGAYAVNDLVNKNANVEKTKSVLSSISARSLIPVSIGVDYKFTNKKDYELSKLKQLVEEKPGVYGLYIKNLRSGEEMSLNKDVKFYSASLYKIPVAVAVLADVNQGRLKLTDKITLQSQDKVGGSGVLQGYAVGTELTVQKVFELLLKESDNTAQNMLVRILSKDLNSYFSEGTSQDFVKTFQVAPYEINLLLQEIQKNKYFDQELTNLFFNTMFETSFDDRISIGLGEHIRFSHKIGNWGNEGSWHDCGIVFENSPIVVCLMSNGTVYEDYLEVAKETGEFITENLL